MSKIKKALKRLRDNHEFFADPSMSLEIYDKWGSKQPLAIRYEYQFAITGSEFDEQRLHHLLKSNKSLVNIILHKNIPAQMEQWYAKNPEELAQKNQRLQNQKFQTLNKLCIDYKEHLHQIIESELKVLTAKIPAIPFEKLHRKFNPELNQAVLPIQPKAEITPELLAEDRTKLPHNCNKNLLVALDKFRLVNALHQTLKVEQPIQQMIEQFERTFNKPQSQTILDTHRDSKGIRFLKAVGHILTLGVVSKIKHNTFKFWECKSKVFANAAQDKVETIKGLIPAP